LRVTLPSWKFAHPSSLLIDHSIRCSRGRLRFLRLHHHQDLPSAHAARDTTYQKLLKCTPGTVERIAPRSIVNGVNAAAHAADGQLACGERRCMPTGSQPAPIAAAVSTW